MSKYAALKAAAEAATPGPWRHVDNSAGYLIASSFSFVGEYRVGNSAQAHADAAFIAEAHPQAVLELIADLERLTTAVKHELFVAGSEEHTTPDLFDTMAPLEAALGDVRMRTGLAATMSSDRMDWETPADFFDKLDAEFDFTLDAAASYENTKCHDHIDEQEDALKTPWDAGAPGAVWLNPPYGRIMPKFIQRAHDEAIRTGRTVVVLFSADRYRDMARLHLSGAGSGQGRGALSSGRLTLVGAPASAPFPSALVVFRRNPP